MKVPNKNIFDCKCGKRVVRLTTSDAEDNSGTVLVDYDSLTREERESLVMKIPVPFDEQIHTNLIHYLKCNLNVPLCKDCGKRIAYFKTVNSSMPMDFNKITKEERYNFILGLPVQYEVSKHRDNNHFANKECKELR